MKTNMTVATLGMIALALAGTLLFGGFREEPFEIGDWSGVDIPQAEADFAASGSNEDLVLLVKALCWRLEAAGDESARAARALWTGAVGQGEGGNRGPGDG